MRQHPLVGVLALAWVKSERHKLFFSPSVAVND
jgi:hypothetical protein